MEPRYRTPRLHGLDVESLYCWWLKKNPCTQLGSIKPNLVDHGISTNLTWCGSSSINSREVFRMNLKNIFEAKTHPPPRLRLFWFILATRGWCFGGMCGMVWMVIQLSSSRGAGPPWCILKYRSRYLSKFAEMIRLINTYHNRLAAFWYRKHNLSGDRFLLCEGLSVHILVPFHRLALRTVQLICNLGHLRLPTNYPTFSVLMYRF